jgi:hypothetical protein
MELGIGIGIGFGRKPLVEVLGPELIPNGAEPYVNTTGWTASTSVLSIVSSKLRVAGSSGGQGRADSASITIVQGATYRFTAGIPSQLATSRLRLGTSAGGTQIANITPAGATSFDFVAPGTAVFVSLVDADVTNPVDFAFVSLKRVTRQ